MPGRELTPQDKQYKSIISSNLSNLLREKGLKQVDVASALNLSFSTINGYFNGKRLPSPENVEKLASFFHVDKSQIDPRYSDSTATNDSHPDIDDTLYYNGKEVPDKYKKIIKDLMDMDD